MRREPSLLRRALAYKAAREIERLDDLPDESPELFEYLESLTDYVPEGRKEELTKEDLVLRIESLRSRLEGRGGLLRRIEQVKAPEPAAADPASKMARAFTFFAGLTDYLPDERIGNALKSKLQKIVGTIRSSSHGA